MKRTRNALQMQATITPEETAQAVARGLRRRFGELRHAAKLVAQMMGCDPRAARNWIEARTAPEGSALLQMMRDIDEVDEELKRLIGRADDAEAARLRAAVSQIEGTLNKLSGGR